MSRQLFTGICLSLLLSGLSSCRNDKYDLDNVSGEIRLGGDLVLPLGNTVVLHLEDLARLDSLQNFYCDLDGNYMFEFSDSVFFSFPEVDRKDLTIPARSYPSKDLSFFFPSAASFIPEEIEASDEGTVDILIEKKDLTKEVIAVDSVVFDKGAMLYLDFKPLDFSSFPSGIRVRVEADFPDCLLFDGNPKLENGHYEYETTLSSGGIRDSLSLKGITYDGEIKDRVFSMEAEIDYKLTLISDGLLEALSGPLNATFTCSLSPLVISSVFGLYDPDFDPLSIDLDFSCIPEKFRNEDNCFDLYPLIRFDARTNVDVPFELDADLIPVFGEFFDFLNMQGVSLDIGPFCDMAYWAGSDMKGVPFGAEFHQIDSKALVEEVPDKISVVIDAKTDTTQRHSYDMFKDHFFNFDYDVQVPLALGKDFKMRLEDTVKIQNIQKLAKLLEGTDFEIVGQVENTFPFDINFTVIPVDKNMQPIDIETSISGIKGSADGKVNVTELSAIMNDLRHNLENLQGFVFSFDGISATEGVCVNKNQYVKASLSAKVSGGVNLNLR